MSALVEFDFYASALLEASWLKSLRAGDLVILMEPAPGVLAQVAQVQRVTKTGLIVVKGRHYDPETGEAVTRRGYLEHFSRQRWGEVCAAATDAVELSLYRVDLARDLVNGGQE